MSTECPICGQKNLPNTREALSSHLRLSNAHKNIGPKKRQQLLDKVYPRVTGGIIHTPSVSWEECNLNKITGIK